MRPPRREAPRPRSAPSRRAAIRRSGGAASRTRRARPAAHGPSRDQVVGLPVCRIAAEDLGPLLDDGGVLQPESIDEAAHRVGLLADRVQQRPVDLGPGQGKHDPGNAAPGAEVQGTGRRRRVDERQGGQRVEQVEPGDGLRLDDARQVRRRFAASRRSDERLEPVEQAGRGGRSASSASSRSSARRAARASVSLESVDKENAPSSDLSVFPADDRRRGRLSHRPRIIRGYRTRSPAEAGRRP